jgi:glucose-1-phosphate adenylyltransferase
MKGILTFILAGGRGERLDPLTRDRTKPAVPFGGIFRIVDFTLSNCINSGLRRVYVLTQYKSFSLQKHILEGWDVVSSQLGEFIDIIPAQQRISGEWYRGTADAIYQNMYAIEDWDPEYVLILSGDHIYKMDYQQMVKTHCENKADLTVACVPMPRETSRDFGVVEVDVDNHILGFEEKPAEPRVIPGQPQNIFASMGIYLFSRRALEEELVIDAQEHSSSRDFGKNIIPQMIARGQRVFVHNFVHEDGRPRYWRDIGTRDSYYEASMALLADKPEFDLYNKSWPVRTHQHQYPPVKICDSGSKKARVINSIISNGCIVEGALVDRSVVSPSVYINKGASVRNSVIMENVTIGENVRIKNAIIDKEVSIPSRTTIGFNRKDDRRRFVLTTSGIVIVPKKTKIDDNLKPER